MKWSHFDWPELFLPVHLDLGSSCDWLVVGITIIEVWLYHLGLGIQWVSLKILNNRLGRRGGGIFDVGRDFENI